MSLMPPGPVKTSPTTYTPLPAVTIARQPVMSLSFPFGCGNQDAVLQLDTMPVMNREPETIPDFPGGGQSYNGYLEYYAMGTGLPAIIGATWIGSGAQSWSVYVDGVALTTFTLYDGTPGPIGIGVPPPSGGWGAGPYTIWLSATYGDRPAFRDFYMDAGTGVGAYAPGSGDCPCGFCPSALWGKLGYWDPWVSDRHGVGDTNGPVDRWGNYIGLTGPWGSDVPQQANATNPTVDLCHTVGVPDGTAFASSLTDFVDIVQYSAISYPVETTHQTLPGCTTTTPYPVFDPTRAFRVTA